MQLNEIHLTYYTVQISMMKIIYISFPDWCRIGISRKPAVIGMVCQQLQELW